jgi:hypothetical protein
VMLIPLVAVLFTSDLAGRVNPNGPPPDGAVLQKDHGPAVAAAVLMSQHRGGKPPPQLEPVLVRRVGGVDRRFGPRSSHRTRRI